ncbi:MAG: hypothetical protein JSS30_06220 [Verrucomicrobia bacterium]|nr:hypothetical protein [Verrucomicrobiota bacterium]
MNKSKNLGDFVLSAYRFENLDEIFRQFKTQEFSRFNHKQKSDLVNRALLELIVKAPDTFLLIAILEYLDKIARENVIINYLLTSFELWLNQFSGLTAEENYNVRGKIVGKRIPRDEYQLLFPVGMGKIHPGSHYVTAHASPDLDTTVASFWGWVDAFAARVSEGIHIWNVPGGAPQSSIEVALLFYHIFGQSVFGHLAKTRSTLALSSLELMTQRGVINQLTNQSSLMIDHERAQKAIILVDQGGYYLGDWRNFDIEGIRQVILLLNNCLRWFESNLHIGLIALFAQQNLSKGDFPKFVDKAFELKIRDCDPAREFNEKQVRHMESYLRKVLNIGQGLNATFAEFARGIQSCGLPLFQEWIDRVRGLEQSALFDNKGKLIENRPQIFHHLEELIGQLDQAIQSIGSYTERLDVALKIKSEVFGYLPQVVSYRDEVEELRSKMGNYHYLTVTSSDEEGKMLPLGVVRSRDLFQPILGTVTLRDFCNRDETKIPSYLEVISVIDHHKCTLQTSISPVVYLSDAQSSNTVVAQLAFSINDQYSTSGMTAKEIEEQINEVKKDLSSASSKRILQKLLKSLQAASSTQTYFIDPLREFVEYLHFLYAILDDTDLLTKVSRRDVEIVAELLNRLKSLMEGKIVEIIHLDDIKRDDTYVQNAASRILHNADMYSLYRKIYLAKEQLVEENFLLCAQGKESSIFVDTKLQNGCARVGQSKLFANNFASFKVHADKLREIWIQQSEDFFTERREYDFYLHMISTVPGAEDLFTGSDKKLASQDEIWLWIPMTEQSIEHLKSFLNEFRASPQILEMQKDITLEFIGPNGHELHKIFNESFLHAPHKITNEHAKYSLSIIRFPAGKINSRKAMISPYLPNLIS